MLATHEELHEAELQHHWTTTKSPDVEVTNRFLLNSAVLRAVLSVTRETPPSSQGMTKQPLPSLTSPFSLQRKGAQPDKELGSAADHEDRPPIIPRAAFGSQLFGTEPICPPPKHAKLRR